MSGRLIRAALRHDSTTIGLDDLHAVSFDRSGRLIRAFWEQRSVRRSLDNRFVVRRRAGPWPWSCERQELSRTDWLPLVNAITEEMFVLRSALDGRVGNLSQADAFEVRDRVAAILRWTPAALQEEGARFRSVYLPIPILPPDQYEAVVVQLTEGCAYNRCTFCRCYRDRAFRVKPLSELTEHVRAVRKFFGAGLSARRGIFLADANALVLPTARILEAFDLLHAELRFGPGRLRAIYSFLDAFSGAAKSPGCYRALAERGLRRVYLGLETGCDELLHFLGKPGSRAGALALVRTLQAAGVGVGVIVLLGVGGAAYRERHVAETLAAVHDMRLGRDDILYLSPLVADPESPYRQQEWEAGIRPLTDTEMAAQLEALRAGIRAGRSGGARVAVYDVRDFLY